MNTAPALPVLVPPHVDEMLDDICKYLQITRTQFEKAVTSYKAVGDWLRAPGSELYKFHPEIYPQGSMALLTTVRPLANEEFDLDLVCQVLFWLGTSKELYEAVGRRLAEHETYRRMLVAKNRCWRLDYAGDFHMDVLPARPDANRGEPAIDVPDRELNCWKPSNPKGYVAWFNSRVDLRRMRAAAAAKLQPVPSPDPFEEPETLRKVVQIMKRHRDVRFADDVDHAPRSIVLTTLAGNHYDGTASTTEASLRVLGGISAEVRSTPGVMKVLNPANSDENFSEKWEKDPEAYLKFVAYIEELEADLRSLAFKPIADGLAADLERLFGKRAADHTLKEYAERLERARDAQRLRYSPVLGLTTSTVGTRPYRLNTHFGSGT
jgi:hypothetical protein